MKDGDEIVIESILAEQDVHIRAMAKEQERDELGRFAGSSDGHHEGVMKALDGLTVGTRGATSSTVHHDYGQVGGQLQKAGFKNVATPKHLVPAMGSSKLVTSYRHKDAPDYVAVLTSNIHGSSITQVSSHHAPKGKKDME